MKKDLWINYNLLHSRVLKKLNEINKPQKHLSEKLKISRVTLFRISKNNEITIETFLKLVNWLDEDVNKFIFRGTKSLAEINTTKKRKHDKVY